MTSAFAGCGTLALAVCAVAAFTLLEEALDLSGAASVALVVAFVALAVAAGFAMRRDA